MAESQSCKLGFFLRYGSVLSEALLDAHVVLKRLEESREIGVAQKEVGVFTWVNGRGFSFAPLRAGTLPAPFGFVDKWGRLWCLVLWRAACARLNNTLQRANCSCVLVESVSCVGDISMVL